jgi:hypothetical protein
LLATSEKDTLAITDYSKSKPTSWVSHDSWLAFLDEETKDRVNDFIAASQIYVNIANYLFQASNVTALSPRIIESALSGIPAFLSMAEMLLLFLKHRKPLFWPEDLRKVMIAKDKVVLEHAALLCDFCLRTSIRNLRQEKIIKFLRMFLPCAARFPVLKLMDMAADTVRTSLKGHGIGFFDTAIDQLGVPTKVKNQLSFGEMDRELARAKLAMANSICGRSFPNGFYALKDRRFL